MARDQQLQAMLKLATALPCTKWLQGTMRVECFGCFIDFVFLSQYYPPMFLLIFQSHCCLACGNLVRQKGYVSRAFGSLQVCGEGPEPVFCGRNTVFWSLGFPLGDHGVICCLEHHKGHPYFAISVGPQCSSLMESFGQESTWINLILLLVL